MCCGAGLDWVTTGDIVIASDKATFFDPHVSIGLVAGREMVRLARVLPRNIALRMALMGKHERMSAQRAYELGMISEVVEHDRLLERAHEIADIVNSNAPLAVRGTRLAIHKTLDLPLHEAEILAETFRERVVRTEDALEGPEGVHGEARPELAVPMTAFETILLDVDATAHVATITLNRPESLNAFNRTMCEEMAEAWRIVKLDDSVNAVVLRAAGSRAFSAGLDIKSPYGQPDNVWNHEDPGELLSPKWQKMWKPVVCAVQGMCTAGAFYFVNESDVVICSDDATFFDSHVSAGLVCALEPIGLMRRVGLGETLRIALMGNDERVSADTALRIGLVSEVVSADRLWARAARDRDGHRRQTAVGDPGHREGDLGVAGQAVPRGDGAEPDLHPAGQSARSGRTRRRCRRRCGQAKDPVMADIRSAGASPTSWPCGRTHPRWSTTASGCRGAASRQLARRDRVARCDGSAQVGILLRNTPAHVAAFLGVLMGGGTVVVINPSRGDERIRADIESLQLPLVIGTRDDLATLVTPTAATTTVAISDLADPPRVIAADRDRRRCRPCRCRGADADQRNDRTTQANRPHLRHAGAQRDRSRFRRVTAPTRTSARGRDRQRPAGAHRRRVPGPAVCLRRPGRSRCWTASS